MADNIITTEIFAAYPDVLTVKQLAEMLNISKSSAYRLTMDKQVKILKVGHSIRILKRSVLEYLETAAS